MADEPTLGEALRRLDAVTDEVKALARALAEDRRSFATTYVPRELYEARHRHLEGRVIDLERGEEERDKTAADTRRQFLFLVLGIAIPAVIGLLLGVASITGAPS